MKTIRYCGSIETFDPEAISALLREWLEVETIDFKVRMEGWCVVFEDETFYLYCYENSKSDFLMQGYEKHSSLNRLKVRLLRLVNLCRERKIGCTIDYVELDENNQETSEEFSVGWRADS